MEERCRRCRSHRRARGCGALRRVLAPSGANGQTTGNERALRDHRHRVGIVKATPDTAEFSFGVETQGATSTEALQKNGAAVKKVIDAIKAAGVAASDIQTQTVSVFPRYGRRHEHRRLHGRQHRQREDP